jgi:hypothetical protein
VVFIGAAFITSVMRNKRLGAVEEASKETQFSN